MAVFRKRLPRPRRVRKTSTKTKSRVSRTVKRYVQRAVNRDIETKHTIREIAPANYNGAATVSGDLIPVLPVISNGSFSYQKLGNEIRLKSIKTRGFIKWQPNTFTEDNVYACIWFIEDKQQKNFQYTISNTPSSTYPNDMFYVLLDQYNEPYAPNGDWNEIGYRFNTKRFNIRRKIIRLTPNYSNLATTTPAAPNEGVGENLKMFSFTRKFGKTGKVLKYPTATANYPENYNPYMFITFFGYSASSGYNTLSNIQVNMACSHAITYEDA